MTEAAGATDNVVRRGERIAAVLTALKAHPDGMPARDALAAAADALVLSEFELGTYKNGDRRFEKLVRFETIEAVKTGWMIKDSGIWEITDEGAKALTRHATPADLARAAQKGYANWKSQQPDGEPVGSEDADPTDEDLAQSVTLEQAEDDATGAIRDHLAALNPYDFQDLVRHLLIGMGYRVSWVAPPGPDGGVDLLAHTDPIGSDGTRIKVQVKREQSKTDPKTLRSFMSALHQGDVGVFVTLGGFTSTAESEARNSETKRIMLIDFGDLLRLWCEYYDRIQPEGQRLLPIRFVPFLSL